MRSVAFLRGINVGGHRVTKDELIAVFTGLGLESVDTFLASGNVLFAPPADRTLDDHIIAAGLEATLGYPVPTTTRTAAEIEALAEHQPFTDDELAVTDGKEQVILLFEPLTAAAEAEAATIVPDGEIVRPGQRALHWLPPVGISTSEFDLDRLATIVGPTTVRTANTIRRLAARLEP